MQGRRSCRPAILLLTADCEVYRHGRLQVHKPTDLHRSWQLEMKNSPFVMYPIAGALLHRGPTSAGTSHSNSLLRDTTERTHCIKPNDVNLPSVLLCRLYEGSPESIQLFWISREPVAWPWCNLAASQRRSYCASVNSPSPVGLVNRQWDAVDWACVLCDCHIHNDRASRSASTRQCACPFYSFCAAKHHITQVCHHPYSPDLASWDFWLFPELKSALKGRRFVNVTVTQYTSSVSGVSLPTD